MSENRVLATYKHLVEANAKLVQKLYDFSGVDVAMIQNFIRFSKSMVNPDTGCLDRPIFRAVLATYFDVIDGYYVKKMYEYVAKRNPSKLMEVEDFAKYLCIFYTDNYDLKIDFIFAMYDSDSDGAIYNHEIAILMQSIKCLTDQDESDKEDTYQDFQTMLSEILEIADGPVYLEAFRQKVYDNSLLLFLCGQLLPPRHTAERFKGLIQGKTNLQMKSDFKHIRSELLYEIPRTNRKKSHYPLVLDLP